MIKRALAFLLCICSVFCMTAVLAKGETCYVTVSFSDEIAECAFYAMKGDGAAYTDSFRSQMNAFELKAYNKLEQKIDFMKKNSGDTIKIDISGMPKVHHGNDDELATLTVPLFTAVYAFEADHPGLFWLSKLHAYTYKYNQNNNEIIELYLKASGANGWRSDAFPTEKSVTDAEKKFDDEVNKIINSVKDKGTYGKLEYFNSFIISNCTYNPKVTSGADYTTLGEMPWCAYSAIIKQTDENKYPVCEGYAKAFKVLCDKAGIRCALVAGSYKENKHMWNMVRMINGLWFYEDATFNDREGKEKQYFLRGSSMEKTHIVNPQFSSSARPLVLPEPSKYDYTNAVGDLLGDANKDGKVNTSDATTILKHSAGISKITDAFAKYCADFNCDSKVNTADAAAILKYCAGM